ncbi:MAG: class I SAM-dependent methyltransferase, partial [Gemmatimonadota bacterium]|nr:class I SAM-dependent methyltransferase [Gemmatimonadota bacterium]
MTETFDAAWLALREEIDHRSRAASLLPPLLEWWTAVDHSSVLDLGCGTGSNLRYLAPKLTGQQAWTLVDHDAALLAHVEPPSHNVQLRSVQGDLAAEGLAEVPRTDLVTASALLDLVSEQWLNALVDACTSGGCGALFSLTYDGRIEWAPEDPFDAVVLDAVNQHQRRNKGTGPALGPNAAGAAEELFRRRGYRTWLADSAWRVGASEAALAQALHTGWAAATVEVRPGDADTVERWADRRRVAIAGGEVEVVVGHQDLLALP